MGKDQVVRSFPKSRSEMFVEVDPRSAYNRRLIPHRARKPGEAKFGPANEFMQRASQNGVSDLMREALD